MMEKGFFNSDNLINDINEILKDKGSSIEEDFEKLFSLRESYAKKISGLLTESKVMEFRDSYVVLVSFSMLSSELKGKIQDIEFIKVVGKRSRALEKYKNITNPFLINLVLEVFLNEFIFEDLVNRMYNSYKSMVEKEATQDLSESFNDNKNILLN